MYYVAYIMYLYCLIQSMIINSMPFHPLSTNMDPFLGVSFRMTGILIIPAIYLFCKARLSYIRRLLFIFLAVPFWFLVDSSLFKLINKFIIIVSVTPDTLSGLVILSGYLLLVSIIIIVPTIYFLSKIPSDSPFANMHPLTHGYNSTLWRTIGFIIDILSFLFLLYNIAYRNQHLHTLLHLTIIIRIAYFLLTAKYTAKISRNTNINIRVISFLVLLSCLAAMFTMTTGFW